MNFLQRAQNLMKWLLTPESSNEPHAFPSPFSGWSKCLFWYTVAVGTILFLCGS